MDEHSDFEYSFDTERILRGDQMILTLISFCFQMSEMRKATLILLILRLKSLFDPWFVKFPNGQYESTDTHRIAIKLD